MGFIECKDLVAKYGRWEGNFSCRFQEGEWHAICGSSGSGKSTLLQLMLGLLAPKSGTICIDNQSVINLPPHRRSMSFMAQYNLLLPHLTIFQNLQLALHDAQLSTKEKSQKIDDIISLLKLESSHLQRRPPELSGGQLSRCNLARALLRPSRWLLLDEPFSAVDRPTRLSILEWLKQWQEKTGSCILLVSHDLDDIFNVASHVTVVSAGRVIESQSLIEAIMAPKHKTTAQLLRGGIVFKIGDSLNFIGSAQLGVHASEINADPDYIDMINFKNARSIPVGKLLRIVDLATGTDVTIPTTSEFGGTLWFDRRNVLSIQDF